MLGKIVAVLRRQYLGARALFIALGGTSYAAVAIEPGSVGSLEIATGGVGSSEVRDGQIRTRDLGRNAVTTSKIAPSAVTASRIAPSAVNSDDVENGSLVAEDFNPRSLPAGKQGDPGPQGEKGDTGSQGAKGDTGPQGVKGDTGPQGVKGDKGDTGAQGPKGDQGDQGSPDTPQQVLDKLITVDGAGSGLDADLFDGLSAADLQRRVTGTCVTGQYVRSISADGGVGCGTDADSGGDITAVSAGTGLTGGATSGAATLGLEVPMALSASAAVPTATMTQTGAGRAFLARIANAQSISEALRVEHNGIGSGVSIALTNSSNGGRGLDVAQAGTGPGVFATSTGGSGLWGITSSISAAGVIGDNQFGEAIVGRAGRRGPAGTPPDQDPSQAGIGSVVGRHDGRGGYGVRGFATHPISGIGVLGQAGISGGQGVGVRGENVNTSNPGNAVEGRTNGAGAGIYGTETSADAAALAGRFDGNVQINGNLTVTGTKTGFSIADPRAPSRRTLNHTPVETDGFAVTYSGNVRTGWDGRATVRLPSYAAVVADRWRYALTPIGRFGQAIVEREVQGGAFVVRTEHPGTKVSWSVTGTRKDAYARRHPFRVVQPRTRAADARAASAAGTDRGRAAAGRLASSRPVRRGR